MNKTVALKQEIHFIIQAKNFHFADFSVKI